MIINMERGPSLSLYYLGAKIIEILSENPILLLDDLYESLKKKEKRNIHIDFFYYALDWLFIQSLIELQGRRVIYVNRKTDRAENSTLGGGYSEY